MDTFHFYDFFLAYVTMGPYRRKSFKHLLILQITGKRFQTFRLFLNFPRNGYH